MKGAAIARGLAPGGRRSLAPGGLVLPSASDIATFGPGGDYTDIGALRAAGLDEGVVAEYLDTGAAFVVGPNGVPIRSWVYRKGTVSRVAYITGDETQDSDLTAHGWTTVDDVDYPGGGVIELDSINNTTSFLSATHTGSSGDLYYMCGYAQLTAFTGGSNSARIPSFAIGDGSDIRYLNLAESTSVDRLHTNVSSPVIAEDIAVSGGLVWLEWMIDGDDTAYGYAGLRGQPSIIASGSGLANSAADFRVQAGFTGTETATVTLRDVSCFLIEV